MFFVAAFSVFFLFSTWLLFSIPPVYSLAACGSFYFVINIMLFTNKNKIGIRSG